MVSKLEKIRTSRGLSQRKLEQLSGVSQQTISRIEKGVPLYKANTAAKLAKVLDCKVSDIMDSVDEGVDNLSTNKLKNIHLFIKALRNTLDINPRRMASMLDMTEKEYLEYESDSADITIEEGLSIISVIIFCYNATKISHNLKANNFPESTSDEEKRVLEAMRAVSPEQREKILHFFQAANLLKF